MISISGRQHFQVVNSWYFCGLASGGDVSTLLVGSGRLGNRPSDRVRLWVLPCNVYQVIDLVED